MLYEKGGFTVQRDIMIQKAKLTALLLAAGVVLPFLGDMVSFGDMLLLAQIPVLLCGLICGAPYGAAVGLFVPLLNFVVTAEPAFYPGVVAATLQYAVMGAAVSPIFRTFTRNAASMYASLATALVSGRIAYLAASYIMLELSKQPYSLMELVKQECIACWPGILLQLLAVPLLTFGAVQLGLMDEK